MNHGKSMSQDFPGYLKLSYCVLLAVWLVNQLKSGNSSVMIKSVQSLQGATPSLDIVKTLLALLVSPTADVSEAVGMFA